MPKNWKEIDRGKSQDDVIRELTNQGVSVNRGTVHPPSAFERLKSFEMRPTMTFSNDAKTINLSAFHIYPDPIVTKIRRRVDLGKPSRRARTRKLLTRGQI